VEDLLSALFFLFIHLCSLAVLAATFFVVGRKLTSGVEYSNVWEEIGVSCTLGFGVTASLLFVLGMIHQLTRPTSRLVIGVLHLASASVWRSTLPRLRSSIAAAPRKRLVAGSLFILLLTAPMLLLALYPPTQFDATLYHLPFATAFVDAGALPFLETLRFPVFPQLEEMLFVLGFFLSGEIAAQLSQFLALLLVAIILIAWGKSMASDRVGVWSAALWIGNPLAVWLGGAAYVDIGLSLFVTASFFAWYRWLRGAPTSWLVLSAAMIGFACASKYLGLFFLAALAAATLIVSFRRKSLRTALIFPSVVMAIAGPWYARIIYYTGNPLFPYYANLFGVSAWSEQPSVNPTAQDGSLVAFAAHQAIEIATHLDFLFLVPFNAVFAREVFHRQAPISPWYLLLIPLLAFPVLRGRTGRWIAALTFAYGLFWLTTIRDIRFLLPILPMVSLALAMGADDFVKRLTSHSSLKPTIHLVAVLLLVAPGWLYGCYKIAQLGPPPTSDSERSEFLSRHVVGYEAIAILNESSGYAYTVYGLFAENLRYYADGRFLGDLFGPNRFAEINRLLPEPPRLHEKLRSLEVEYLLIVPRKQSLTLAEDGKLGDYFTVVARSDHYLLMRCHE